MLRRLFSSLAPRQARETPIGSIPPGQRVYAVGDIHGRLDLLDDLLDRIERDDATRPPLDTTLIFLGDLIDRGPDSAQVVERLRQLSAAVPTIRFLLGNHEEVFLKVMADEKGALPFFIRIGGKPTALSYGITEAEYLACDYPALLALLRARVPQEHLDFLSRFEDLIIIGDYAFVHAGVDPALPLDQQRTGSLRWIREEFLGHCGALEKIIVHGHTVTTEVEERACRIGIDTGAFASNRLTAIGLEGDSRWFLQTR